MSGILSLDDVAESAVKAPLWVLAPSVSRVRILDQHLRLKLADSLVYLAGVASLTNNRPRLLASMVGDLRSGPVSPWVFCLYSKLVAELTESSRGDVATTFGAIAEAVRFSAGPSVVPLYDPHLPRPWWDHFRVLFDTDPRRSFRPKAPSEGNLFTCEANISESLALLSRGDPQFYQEVTTLIRMLVLAVPADPSDRFNGASTFFLWGASLLNAEIERSSIAMVDLLIHESSHVLLFGISADGALTENSGSERYDSPLRKDKRPIDGIFHACFVATRVHLAMNRLLLSGALNHEQTKLANERGEYNGNAALNSIKELGRHARLTPLGEKVYGTLRDYWANVAQKSI